MSSNNTALVANRLRDLRERQGWSRRKLALLCGIGENQILKYERGENDPSALSLKLIAERLGVSIDYLLGATDDPRGHWGDNELDDNEKAVLETFRREGWLGIARLSVEKLAK
jgi:transcriptional regulator with XRE-family HTH domain